MHDGVSLEQLGTPAVTLCAEEFRGAAQAQAQALGMPDHRIVVIGHPLAAMMESEIQQQAQRAWPQVLRYLLQGG